MCIEKSLEEMFDKSRNSDEGEKGDEAEKQMEKMEAASRYYDLVLIHFPAAWQKGMSEQDARLQTWEAMEAAWNSK